MGFLEQFFFTCDNSYFLEKSFIEVADMLEGIDVPVMPVYGTLLGLIRENRLLPHEYDIDLGKWNTRIQDIPLKFICKFNCTNQFQVLNAHMTLGHKVCPYEKSPPKK